MNCEFRTAVHELKIWKERHEKSLFRDAIHGPRYEAVASQIKALQNHVQSGCKTYKHFTNFYMMLQDSAKCEWWRYYYTHITILFLK